MNKTDLESALRCAAPAFAAIDQAERDATRRKPCPAELICAAKSWAERLLESIEIFPGPSRKLRRAISYETDNRPARYADEIKAAESILAVLKELVDPVAVVMRLRQFPECTGIRYLPDYVRAVEGKRDGKTHIYFFYRRLPDFEVRLPDDPTGSGFMTSYRRAEQAYAGRDLHRRRRPQPEAMAIAA